MRFRDAPLDKAVGQLVAHLREFRPEIVVTRDAHGGLTEWYIRHDPVSTAAAQTELIAGT
ncbi:hypothetical protein [Streptomyces sp. NBC_00009]|uniref:hypothetical protein n=1 Tax=Streptomyces sp. NBC_00009 TaxID=2975620 RepID=UPI003865B15E